MTMAEYLYSKLKAYADSEYYGFHMPGHKRNQTLTGAELPYEIDITEISGFDDLHHADGILKAAQQRAAELYHAQETHYLINGSTVGILSAVMGCTRPGGKILMARNCHKSVYNAVFLNGLTPVYVYPEIWNGMNLNGEIQADEVRRLLEEHEDIQAVIVTSPTYDGVVSDVKALAHLAHCKGIPLIVDEAHGAHFGFHPYFPENGNCLGADLVIHSLHKTLPALTQTALLHINGNIVDRKNVRRYLHMLQSSSPSYVLMAGIDECIRLLKTEGQLLFDAYVERLAKARKRMEDLECLHLFEAAHYDRSKIVISCENALAEHNGEIKKYTGKDLYIELKENYFLEMEMSAPEYIIALTSLGDTEEGMRRLTDALRNIDRKLAKNGKRAGNYANCVQTYKKGQNQQVLIPSEAVRISRERAGERRGCQKMRETIASAGWRECAGKIALEYAYVYPPGIPLAVPGERISEETARELAEYEALGFEIQGTNEQGRIEVLING